MLQIPGKTRRGRPPKYQQYWLALARQKAEERLRLSSDGHRAIKEKDESEIDCYTVTNDKCQDLENSTTEKAGLQHTGRDLPGIRPSSPRRCHVRWKLGDGAQPREPRPNEFHSAAELDEGPFPATKKFRQERSNSDDPNGQRSLSSTWADRFVAEVLGCDAPLMLTTSLQPVVTHSLPKSQEVTWIDWPESVTLDPEDARRDSYGHSKAVVVTEERTRRSDGHEFAAVTLKNWTADSERCDLVLDLSNDRTTRRSSGDVRELIAESLGTPVAADGTVPQVGTPENRKSRNSLPSWNSGQAQNGDQHPSWNVQNGSRKHGHPVRPSPFRIPSEVSMWTVDEVARFVSSVPGCRDYAECFRQHDIDGQCLLRLSEDHLLNVIRMKLGPSLHLKTALDDLTGVDIVL